MYPSLYIQIGCLALLVAASAAYAQIPTPNSRLGDAQCTVSASSNGEYDLGRLSGSLLKANANTVLAPISKTWTISCDADTYLTFTAVDNRAVTVSVPASDHFGLGQVNGTGKIGFYTIIMKNAAVDGTKTNVFSSNGTSFNPVMSTGLSPNNSMNGWANVNNVLKSGSTFTAELEIQPTLASVATMNGPITDSTEVDGSVSLHFSFGL